MLHLNFQLSCFNKVDVRIKDLFHILSMELLASAALLELGIDINIIMNEIKKSSSFISSETAVNTTAKQNNNGDRKVCMIFETQ